MDWECDSAAGSRLAGVDGATPAIIMSGAFLLGARCFPEQAPDLALDRANNAAKGVKVDVLVGVLHDCAVVFEDSAIDPIAQHEQVSCRSIALDRDGELELVRYGFIDRPRLVRRAFQPAS